MAGYWFSHALFMRLTWMVSNFPSTGLPSLSLTDIASPTARAASSPIATRRSDKLAVYSPTPLKAQQKNLSVCGSPRMAETASPWRGARMARAFSFAEREAILHRWRNRFVSANVLVFQRWDRCCSASLRMTSPTRLARWKIMVVVFDL